jgi:hypothetical protein
LIVPATVLRAMPCHGHYLPKHLLNITGYITIFSQRQKYTWNTSNLNFTKSLLKLTEIKASFMLKFCNVS